MTDPDGCVCARCNSVDPDSYDYRGEIQKLIDQHGIAITGVFPASDVPGSFWFVYTIGMAEYGLPDLIVTGVPGEVASPFLEHLATIMRDNREMWRSFFDRSGGEINVSLPFDDGPEEIPLRFRRTIVLGEPPLGGLNLMYGPDAEVFQVLVSAEDGAWPDEPEWDAERYGAQPMLQEWTLNG